MGFQLPILTGDLRISEEINRIIHHWRDLSSGISLKKKDWIASRNQGWQRQS